MISFVILHYNDLKVTTDCIQNLLMLNQIEKCRIIVVDNASPNGSGLVLQEQYLNNDLIDVILLKNNIGFAKGNDVGYHFAKSNSENSYIVVMNNDVMITDKGFIDKLLFSKLENKAEVILPDIISKNGKHQNPYRTKPMSTLEIICFLILKIVLLVIYYLPIICKLWQRKNKTKQSDTCVFDVKNLSGDLIPHGSCVIYTKKWIEKENIAFIPETFMYHEEDILYEYMLNRGYKTIYYSDIIVNHLEDVSTNSIANSDLKKARFQLKHSIFPVVVLLKVRKANCKKTHYQLNRKFLDSIDNEIIETE